MRRKSNQPQSANNKRRLSDSWYRKKYYQPLQDEVLDRAYNCTEWVYALTLKSYGLDMDTFKKVLTKSNVHLRRAIGEGTWFQSLEWDDDWHMHYVVFSQQLLIDLNSFFSAYLKLLNKARERQQLVKVDAVSSKAFIRCWDNCGWVNYCFKHCWWKEHAHNKLRFTCKKSPMKTATNWTQYWGQFEVLNS